METKTNWKLLEKMNDSEIDYFDISETDFDFWNDANIVTPHKKKVELKIEVYEEIAVQKEYYL